METSRKETVRRLIEQFENHPNKNMLLKDSEKSEEIKHFSQECKDLITEMDIPKSSSSTRPLRRDSVRIAPHIGKMVSYSAHAENICSLRIRVDSSTKADLTYCRLLNT